MRNFCPTFPLGSLLVSVALWSAAAGCGGGGGEGTDSSQESEGGTGDTGGTGGTDATSGVGGTESTGGAPAACFDYASFDGASPGVSFLVDVLPLFRRSCGLSAACHNQQDPFGQPYLGPMLGEMVTPQNIDDILKGIVDVAALKEPGMAIVKTGDPEHSFLMHKIDGTLSCDALACAADQGCGTPMPQGAKELLPLHERDTIRRWIAQGAKNN